MAKYVKPIMYDFAAENNRYVMYLFSATKEGRHFYDAYGHLCNTVHNARMTPNAIIHLKGSYLYV